MSKPDDLEARAKQARHRLAESWRELKQKVEPTQEWIGEFADLSQKPDGIKAALGVGSISVVAWVLRMLRDRVDAKPPSRVLKVKPNKEINDESRY